MIALIISKTFLTIVESNVHFGRVVETVVISSETWVRIHENYFSSVLDPSIAYFCRSEER